MLNRSTTRVLGLLCVMYFITYVDRVNVSTAAIEFGKEFALSNTQVGFVFSAFAYPVPAVSDHRRLGRRSIRPSADADDLLIYLGWRDRTHRTRWRADVAGRRTHPAWPR